MNFFFKGLFVSLFCLAGSALFAQAGVIIPGPRATNNGPFIVRFTSDIAGAPVYINGRYTNTMNFATRLGGGVYDIRVTAPGHPDWRREVTIQGNTTITANFTDSMSQPLPQNYSIRLSANIGDARFFVDGRPAGHEMQLPPGRYRFRVERQGYRPWERTLDINGDTDLQAQLEPELAILSLDMEHPGRVEWRIDGRVHWTEQRFPRLEITPGPHELEVISGGFRTKIHLDLAPGHVYTLKPQLIIEESRGVH